MKKWLVAMQNVNWKELRFIAIDVIYAFVIVYFGLLIWDTLSGGFVAEIVPYAFIGYAAGAFLLLFYCIDKPRWPLQ